MPRTKKPPSGEKIVIGIRCTTGFRDHLARIAATETRTPSEVIERALKAYAEANEHEPFPPR